MPREVARPFQRNLSRVASPSARLGSQVHHGNLPDSRRGSYDSYLALLFEARLGREWCANDEWQVARSNGLNKLSRNINLNPIIGPQIRTRRKMNFEYLVRCQRPEYDKVTRCT